MIPQNPQILCQELRPYGLDMRIISSSDSSLKFRLRAAGLISYTPEHTRYPVKVAVLDSYNPETTSISQAIMTVLSDLGGK